MGIRRSNLKDSLTILQKWCKQNGMLLNTEKTDKGYVNFDKKEKKTSLLSLT